MKQPPGMNGSRLHPAWPTRQVELAIGGISLLLRIPDHPHALLDLSAVQQASRENDYMPYWAHMWPAGLMLGQWLVQQVSGTGEGPPGQRRAAQPPARVLEIGCGLAVPGLLAARLGYQVTLADYDPDAVEYARQNGRLNGVEVATELLDWRRPSGSRYPLILGGDLLYEQRNHQPLFEFFRLSLEQGGLVVLGDPCRLTADGFLHDACSAGWRAQSEPTRWLDVPGRIILLRQG